MRKVLTAATILAGITAIGMSAPAFAKGGGGGHAFSGGGGHSFRSQAMSGRNFGGNRAAMTQRLGGHRAALSSHRSALSSHRAALSNHRGSLSGHRAALRDRFGGRGGFSSGSSLPPGFSHGNKNGWSGNTPPGWSHGNKTGWSGNRPPGLSKH